MLGEKPDDAPALIDDNVPALVLLLVAFDLLAEVEGLLLATLALLLGDPQHKGIHDPLEVVFGEVAVESLHEVHEVVEEINLVQGGDVL